MKYLNTKRHLSFYIVLTAVLTALLTAGAAAATDAATGDPPPRDPPPEAERSESGLAWLVLAEGTGTLKPDANDLVNIYYTGWTPTGAKFDSNDGARPAQVSLDKVSPGWREALQLMVSGEKRRLWIPAHLAPANPKRGPKGDVIFDVELLGVYDIPSPPPGLPDPPEDAESTLYGAFTKVLDPGRGEVTAGTGGGVLAHYTVWTEDGQMVDSSITRRRPTLFIWGKVMPAVGDVLKGMKEGERRWIWVPASLAAGQWPGAPEGALVFETEVVKIMAEDIAAPVPEGARKKPEGG